MRSAVYALLVVLAHYQDTDKLSSFLDLKSSASSFAAVRDAELNRLQSENPGMGSMSKADWVLVKNGVQQNMARSMEHGSHMGVVADHLPHHSDRYFNHDEWSGAENQYQLENAHDLQDKTYAYGRKAEGFLKGFGSFIQNPGMGSMSKADWVLVKNGVQQNMARSMEHGSHMGVVPDHLPHHTD